MNNPQTDATLGTGYRTKTKKKNHNTTPPETYE